MNINNKTNVPTTPDPTQQGAQALSSDKPFQSTAAEFFRSGLVVPTVPLGSSTGSALADQFQQLSTSTSEQLALYLPKQTASGGALGFPHARIRTQQGRTYELLNTLNSDDSARIQQQFGLHFQDKVVLGSGNSGKIRFAKNTENQHVVVVKKMPSVRPNGTRHNSLEDATHEAHIMSLIGQRCAEAKPNPQFQDIEKSFVLSLDHQHRAKANQPQGFENKSYLFYELATAGDGIDQIGTLSRLRNTGKHQEAEALFKHMALQFTETVMHLHALGVHHRDIKPDNFLCFNAPNPHALPHIRLGDFGFAQEDVYSNLWMGDTPAYTPPEANPLLRNHLYQAEKHDCFSLGMSLLVLKKGVYPYQSKDSHHLTLTNTQGAMRNIRLQFTRADSDLGEERQRCQGVHYSVLENLDMTHFDCIVAKLIAKRPADRISAKQAFDLLSHMA